MRLFVWHPLIPGAPKPMDRLRPLTTHLVPGYPKIMQGRDDAKVYAISENEWITDNYLQAKDDYHQTPAYQQRYSAMAVEIMLFGPRALIADLRSEDDTRVPLATLTLTSQVARSFPVYPMVVLVSPHASASGMAVGQVMEGMDHPPRIFHNLGEEVQRYLHHGRR